MDLYEATLFENQRNFLRPVVVHATDRDDQKSTNSKVTYAIAPTTYADHFAVNTNGEVLVVKSFDYEAVAALYNESSAVIDLQVLALDAGEPPLSSTATLKVFLQ